MGPVDEPAKPAPDGDPGEIWDRLSFLAPPDHVSDWRMVLLYEVAFEAGVLSGLPATAVHLADRLQLDPELVRVVLDALSWWGIVEAEGDGRYALATDLAGPQASAVLRHHARAIHHWSGKLAHHLLSGGHNRGPTVSGRPVRPRGAEQWLDALAVNARASAPSAVALCRATLPAVQRVLDLGGGHGEYALEFARRGLHATMQDRPEVVELARSRGRLQAAGVGLFAGDFFETLPPGVFDIIFCAGVTYTYGGQRNRELFQRLRPAIAAGGALVILTFLRGADPVASIFAVQMAISGSGADTHSEADYRRWLEQAGFDSVECLDLERQGESLVVARCRPGPLPDAGRD